MPILAPMTGPVSGRGCDADAIDELLTTVARNSARLDALESQVGEGLEQIAELHAHGLASTRQAEQLRQALRTSRRIGAAIGIVMARCAVSEEKAFDALAQASMGPQRKLRDLADEIVETGSTHALRVP